MPVPPPVTTATAPCKLKRDEAANDIFCFGCEWSENRGFMRCNGKRKQEQRCVTKTNQQGSLVMPKTQIDYRKWEDPTATPKEQRTLETKLPHYIFVYCGY